MRYILNESMQEMSLGEGEGTVYFDGESGNTHVLDEVAQDVLETFKTESDLDRVVALLASRYDEEERVIRSDVEEFVKALCEKEILLPQD